MLSITGLYCLITVPFWAGCGPKNSVGKTRNFVRKAAGLGRMKSDNAEEEEVASRSPELYQRRLFIHCWAVPRHFWHRSPFGLSLNHLWNVSALKIWTEAKVSSCLRRCEDNIAIIKCFHSWISPCLGHVVERKLGSQIVLLLGGGSRTLPFLEIGTFSNVNRRKRGAHPYEVLSLFYSVGLHFCQFFIDKTPPPGGTQ